mmetsp:Transcript_12875/g.36195  ORF Transcript_12875/g.36195 Transcript_12875/m.36195 type:complete len:236 (-) Transcript_12875:1166-1873(-)
MVTVKVVKIPGLLETATDPECLSTRVLTRASPRPVLRETLAGCWGELHECTNGSNTMSSMSAGIPGPVSLTSTTIWSPFVYPFRVIVPADRQNLTEFPSRLKNTCTIRSLSPLMGARSGGMIVFNSTFAARRGVRRTDASDKQSMRLTGPNSSARVSWPQAAVSSRLLTMRLSRLPLLRTAWRLRTSSSSSALMLGSMRRASVSPTMPFRGVRSSCDTFAAWTVLFFSLSFIIMF